MIFVLALAALLPLALAQYGNNGGGGSSSSHSAHVATPTATALQTIAVGQGGNLKFSPESLVVAMGSSVVFEFYPGHHSVVQGSFDKPCSPSSGLAFYSGFVDSSSGPASQVFTVAVDNADPIWFYCGAPSHCQNGMVGVINPTTNKTLEMYRSGAANSSTTNLPKLVQGGVLNTTSSATTTGSTTSTTSNSGPANAVISFFGLASSFLALFLVGPI